MRDYLASTAPAQRRGARSAPWIQRTTGSLPQSRRSMVMFSSFAPGPVVSSDCFRTQVLAPECVFGSSLVCDCVTGSEVTKRACLQGNWLLVTHTPAQSSTLTETRLGDAEAFRQWSDSPCYFEDPDLFCSPV
jgi:hypothetical protein